MENKTVDETIPEVTELEFVQSCNEKVSEIYSDIQKLMENQGDYIERPKPDDTMDATRNSISLEGDQVLQNLNSFTLEEGNENKSEILGALGVGQEIIEEHQRNKQQDQLVRKMKPPVVANNKSMKKDTSQVAEKVDSSVAMNTVNRLYNYQKQVEQKRNKAIQDQIAKEREYRAPQINKAKGQTYDVSTKAKVWSSARTDAYMERKELKMRQLRERIAEQKRLKEEQDPESDINVIARNESKIVRKEKAADIVARQQQRHDRFKKRWQDQKKEFVQANVQKDSFRPKTNPLSDAIRQEKNFMRQKIEEDTPSAIAAIYSTELSSHNFLSRKNPMNAVERLYELHEQSQEKSQLIQNSLFQRKHPFVPTIYRPLEGIPPENISCTMEMAVIHKIQQQRSSGKRPEMWSDPNGVDLHGSPNLSLEHHEQQALLTQSGQSPTKKLGTIDEQDELRKHGGPQASAVNKVLRLVGQDAYNTPVF